MPTPEHTSVAAIVAAARRIVEADGMSALTMQAVADQVGVRAPSLYKRVRDRDELILLMVESTLDELRSRLQSTVDAAPIDDPRTALIAVANAVRDFVRHNPHCYALTLGPLPSAAQPPIDVARAAVTPLMHVIDRLVGPGEALNAARTITAWANGFLLMEFAGAFQLGGDIDQAFDWGLSRIVDALARTPAPSLPTTSDTTLAP